MFPHYNLLLAPGQNPTSTSPGVSFIALRNFNFNASLGFRTSCGSSSSVPGWPHGQPSDSHIRTSVLMCPRSTYLLLTSAVICCAKVWVRDGNAQRLRTGHLCNPAKDQASTPNMHGRLSGCHPESKEIPRAWSNAQKAEKRPSCVSGEIGRQSMTSL